MKLLVTGGAGFIGSCFVRHMNVECIGVKHSITERSHPSISGTVHNELSGTNGIFGIAVRIPQTLKMGIQL